MWPKMKSVIRRLVLRVSQPVITRILAPEIALLKTMCGELKLEVEILSEEISEMRGQAKLSSLSATDRKLVSLYEKVTPEK